MFKPSICGCFSCCLMFLSSVQLLKSSFISFESQKNLKGRADIITAVLQVIKLWTQEIKWPIPMMLFVGNKTRPRTQTCLMASSMFQHYVSLIPWLYIYMFLTYVIHFVCMHTKYRSLVIVQKPETCISLKQSSSICQWSVSFLQYQFSRIMCYRQQKHSFLRKAIF